MTEDRSSAEAWGSAARARAEAESDTGADAAATRWLLEAARLQAGMSVAEIACGAGRVGLAAAEIVYPGRVVCTDYSSEMVAVTRERAASLDRQNVETRELDAVSQSLEREFDVVLCQFGYMLMPDPGAALSNGAGALVPGGRLVATVWGTAEENPWLMTIFREVMDAVGAPPPPPGSPGPFALGDPGHLSNLLAEAGLSDAYVERIETRQQYASREAWWDQILNVSGPLAAVLGALEGETVSRVRAGAFERAAEYVGADGSLDFPAVVLGAAGTAPSA